MKGDSVDAPTFDTGMVNNNGPSTSYSSAANNTMYCMQITTATLHNASNDHMHNSIATHNNNSEGACGLDQKAQNFYEDRSIHNTGFSIHDQYRDGGGSTLYQHGIPNLPPARPFYPLNNPLDPANMHDHVSTSSSRPSYHTSLFTNVPRTLREDEHDMQLSSGGPSNLSTQSFINMFSGSIYQAPKRVMREGSTKNNIDSQLNNPQQSGDHGPIRRNRRDTPPFNSPPY